MDHVCRKAEVEEMDQPPHIMETFGRWRRRKMKGVWGKVTVISRVRGKGDVVELSCAVGSCVIDNNPF
jgi:hypothetical protein